MKILEISIVLKYLEQFEQEGDRITLHANRMSRRLGPKEYDMDICIRALQMRGEGYTDEQIIEQMEKSWQKKERGF
jgi:hypothetical protein